MAEMFESIELSQIGDRVADSDFDVLEIKYFSNIEYYQSLIEKILIHYKLQYKDGYAGYKGIGLQYFDEKNKLYDVVNQVSYLDANGKIIYTKDKIVNYTKKNEIGVLFEDFFSFFRKEIELRRGRILIAEPGFCMKPHTDGASTGTLHYAVKTNQQSHVYIEGRKYHIPESGKFYLVNTAKNHWIENQSKMDRVHITFPLNPLCFKSITRRQYEKMKDYFIQLNLDVNAIQDRISD